VKGASGKVGIYTSVRLAQKDRYIATAIASISVSVAKLLVLPVWGTVSASGLCLLVFSIVEGVNAGKSGSGVPENCVIAAEVTLKCLHVAQSLLLSVLVDFYFRFAYAVKTSQHQTCCLDCT